MTVITDKLLVDVIKESKLPDNVKEECIATVNSNAADFDNRIRNLQWQAPELRRTNQFVIYLMGNYLGEVLLNNELPHEVGHELSREIYSGLNEFYSKL